MMNLSKITNFVIHVSSSRFMYTPWAQNSQILRLKIKIKGKIAAICEVR